MACMFVHDMSLNATVLVFSCACPPITCFTPDLCPHLSSVTRFVPALCSPCCESMSVSPSPLGVNKTNVWREEKSTWEVILPNV